MSCREILNWFRTLALFAPLAMMASSTAAPPTHANVHYAAHWRQSLDLYLPLDHPGPYPVVVYVHGGGWLAGDKSAATRYADDLLARGFALAAINYRYSFHATFPAQLHDCKGAIRWLRANAPIYGLDLSRIAVFGESSGGHLASLVGTVNGNAELEGTVGGNTGHSSRVRAVVHGYGPSDLFELAEFDQERAGEISTLVGHDIHDIIANMTNPAYAGLVALVHSANPANHAGPNDPTTFLVHGEADAVVPASQSALLANALNDAGVPETFDVLPGVGHELPDDELPALYAFLSGELAPLPELLAVSGAGAGDRFGHAVAWLGDVNNDGVDDFAVGAPLNDDAGLDAGRVTMHSGATGATLRVLRGAAPGDRFGWSIAAAGDINGDGRPDVAIGAPRSDLNGADSGRVDVFTARTGTRLRTLRGDRAGDQLGYAVAAADVDGDGRRDVICGAPYADAPATNSGAVLVFLASDWRLLPRIKGALKGDHLGLAVAAAGDVDGDGRGDLIVSAPHADSNGPSSGWIKVVGWDNSKWVTRFARQGAAGEQIGFSVAGAGDVDGDGFADIIVGSPHGMSSGGVVSGIARIYSVRNNLTIATLQPVNPQAGEQFGAAVASAGDVDADDRPDVLVGSWKHDLAGTASGRVTVYSGGGPALQVLNGPFEGAHFGRSLAGRGDIDSNGRPDAIVGAPGMIVGAKSRGEAIVIETGTAP